MKKWGVDDLGRISSSLTTKSIRKLTTEEKNLAIVSWGNSSYWVEFEEKININGRTVSGIFVFKYTFFGVLAEQLNRNTDTFYFFVHFLGQKKEFTFQRYFEDEGKNGQPFFCLSSSSFGNKSGSADVDKIILQEKAKWDNLGYTTEEDKIWENKKKVDKGVVKGTRETEEEKPKDDNKLELPVLTKLLLEKCQELTSENTRLKAEITRLTNQIQIIK